MPRREREKNKGRGRAGRSCRRRRERDPSKGYRGSVGKMSRLIELGNI